MEQLHIMSIITTYLRRKKLLIFTQRQSEKWFLCTSLFQFLYFDPYIQVEKYRGFVLDFAKRIGYKESRADTINPLGKISFRYSPLNWAHLPLRTINCIISFMFNVFLYPQSCHKRTIMPNGFAGIGSNPPNAVSALLNC